jgi:hypothetical protein
MGVSVKLVGPAGKLVGPFSSSRWKIETIRQNQGLRISPMPLILFVASPSGRVDYHCIIHRLLSTPEGVAKI